jgi:hypothetical protein
VRRVLGSGCPGIRPSSRGVLFLQVGWAEAQGQAHPSAWTRDSPRYRMGDAAATPPCPGAARRTVGPSLAGRCLARRAVQGWNTETNPLLAPQRDVGARRWTGSSPPQDAPRGCGSPGILASTWGACGILNTFHLGMGRRLETGLKPSLFFLAGRRSSAVGNRRVFSRLLRLLAGLRRMGQDWAETPFLFRTEPAGPPTAQHRIWPFAAC